MIQDIMPSRLRNEFENRQPEKDSRMMMFRGNEICIKKDGELDFPRYEELENWCAKAGGKTPETVYLFSVGEEEYFLAGLPEKSEESPERKVSESPEKEAPESLEREVPEPSEEKLGEPSEKEAPEPPEENFAFVRMFAVRAMHPKARVFAAATAWHLYGWYRDNQYCGRCGHRLSHDEKLRMLSCPACGNQVFPKIAPAVIVGVTDGERILMTKYANREYKRYALIAGFTEIGETAEETVRREVAEEVGLHVKNIRYYKSQPWGFDSNLLLGYFCELDDAGEIVLDTGELATAEWVHYKDIPDDPEGLSLTREMMTVFRDKFPK